MAGLVDDEAAKAAEGLDVQQVRAAMKLPPELQDPYERVVAAGGQFMFGDGTHKQALQALQQGQGPVSQRLGDAIAGLLLMLFEKSKGTMPPQVIIPAGIDLLTQAADFLQKSQAEPITPADVGEALARMITVVMEKFGADPAKLQQAVESGQVPGGEAAAAPPEQPAEPQPGQEM